MAGHGMELARGIDFVLGPNQCSLNMSQHEYAGTKRETGAESIEILTSRVHKLAVSAATAARTITTQQEGGEVEYLNY